MLKLEKTASSGLTLRFREQERYFEPYFLFALAIAIAFHGGIFLLFHVSPFHLSSTFVFPPAHVQTPLLSEEISLIVLTTPENEAQLLLPPLPFVPALAWTTPLPDSILTPQTTLDLQAFKSLEERIWPIWQTPLPLFFEEPSITLTFFGDLSRQLLVRSDPLLDKTQKMQGVPVYLFVTYQVQMDEKTGEIVWYERTQSSGQITIDRLTEKIVLNLRFAPKASFELVKGTLQFAVIDTDSFF